MINKLKEINEKCIEENKNNPEKLKKHKLIKEILNQKDCFFNMSIEYAYAILRDLEIPENELITVYRQLI
jgi:hypothetical protein